MPIKDSISATYQRKAKRCLALYFCEQIFLHLLTNLRFVYVQIQSEAVRLPLPKGVRLQIEDLYAAACGGEQISDLIPLPLPRRGMGYKSSCTVGALVRAANVKALLVKKGCSTCPYCPLLAPFGGTGIGKCNTCTCT